MRNYTIVNALVDGKHQMIPLSDDAAAVRIVFDIGFGTYSQAAVNAVENGNIPSVLRGNDDLGKPRVSVGHERDGKKFVKISADPGYGGPIFARVGEDLDELLDWLDEFFTIIDTRANPKHWREQEGAYSPRAVSFMPITQSDIDKIIDRERLFSATNAQSIRDAKISGSNPLVI